MALRLSHDEEFDWAAAVREIDDACHRVTSASNSGNFCHVIPDETRANGFSAKGRKEAGARQSTLDEFVRTNGKCDIRDQFVNIDDNPCSNEAPCTKIDLEAAKTWIYPVNIPLRDYQLSITKTALFSNTLVALPTGLGKTLIAAVVMYNYFRWFPEGKIVFAAPSRPLVMQQIEACHNIVGIPQEWTIDMTGQMSPSERPSFWKAKRIFFLTPQVLEKDIRSGVCIVKQIVCLVIDEAHRAMGNYSYCVAVRELMAVPVKFRILALTATPGSKQQTIQKVIDNLHISILEYRNESHPDVSPYVHSRKLELIKVAMGKEAIGINNLLLEVIHPFVSRLNALGVLSSRDSATLSPCQLLTSRDRFRQAPPMNLPQAKFGEVEGFFGVLITLYHIRKLLSSHGIKPAYEMLHEKLQQGSFARIMCKNEAIWQAKLLMEQSLSHGAPNPKLLKMVEVLVDHFRTKDPKNSRVIIFSNFRGSVKDIMETLSNIGDSIKATQFIGQSSGKTSMGQSQKLQQAVLRKFRAGGYNVIVATSIGEEGLDIMEVDLVICFDANISPLRMIQRMGRTGRKHNGRVVVLACEGSELKGYLTKKENSKSVAKHMHNGGTNSFNFHSSPRMVPHICKPEVQFVELSIEQFVPRGRKGKREPVDESKCGNTISGSEADLIAKYFSSSDDVWKPSLIAFPHFQCFPSRIHKVRHSFRSTAMLIDTVQLLKELSSFKAEPTHQIEFCNSSSQQLEVVDAAQDYSSKKDSTSNSEAPQALSESKISDLKQDSSQGNCRTDDDQHIPDISNLNIPVHSFLFGADFVSVDAIGRVLITSVPMLPLVKEALNYKGISTENVIGILTSTDKVTSPYRTAQEDYGKEILGYVDKSLPDCDAHPQQATGCIEETVPQTPIAEGKVTENSNDDDNGDDDREDGTPNNRKKELPILLVSDSGDMELSPRLTDFVEKGIVPESPMVKGASPKPEAGIDSISGLNPHEKKTPTGKTRCTTKLFDSKETCPASTELHASHDMPEVSTGTCHPLILRSKENKKADMDTNSGEINLEGNVISVSPVDKENRTPLVNRSSGNCIEDWQMSAGEASKKSNQQPRKLKRLRKHGDIGQKPLSSRTMGNKCSGIRTNLCEVFTATESRTMKHRTSGKLDPKARMENFIDEEAEVSSDAEVSADEGDGMDESEYEDSFIDDRVNPTVASTQAEGGGDMMAVYRRSLLTQSPADDQLNWYYANLAHESTSPTPTRSESCCSTRMNNSLQRTPDQSNGRKIMVSRELGSESVSIASVACKSETTAEQRECKIDIRKRKLSFKQPEEHWVQPETTGKTPLDNQSHNLGLNGDPFSDDWFYESLDLDEMEAQAAKMLREKSEGSVGKKQMASSVTAKVIEDMGEDFLLSPSFDLGI